MKSNDERRSQERYQLLLALEAQNAADQQRFQLATEGPVIGRMTLPRAAPNPSHFRDALHEIIETSERETTRVLLILDESERLVTFTKQDESCTVQDLLTRFGVQLNADTEIQVVENLGFSDINYEVTVGKIRYLSQRRQ